MTTLKCLLDHGADVNTKDAEGMTPLRWTVIQNYTEMAKFLREHGAR